MKYLTYLTYYSLLNIYNNLDINKPLIKVDKVFFQIIIILLLYNSGCAHLTDRESHMIAYELRTVVSIQIPFNTDKVVWSNINNTLFIANKNDNTISIYRDDKIINRIGGLGFGKDSFNRLTDITLSPNGKLLALDSFQKSIKQFDDNGKWMENHYLSEVHDPYLLDVRRDGTVYIYDKQLNEVLIYDDKLNEVIYRFGKFYFKNPISLVCNDKWITVYDKDLNTSFIFDQYGRLERELSGNYQVDRHFQKYLLDTNKLIIHKSDSQLKSVFSSSPADYFIVKNGFLIQAIGRQIIVSQIVYNKPRNLSSKELSTNAMYYNVISS